MVLGKHSASGLLRCSCWFVEHRVLGSLILVKLSEEGLAVMPAKGLLMIHCARSLLKIRVFRGFAK